jgi:ribosomal-protein-serine acetyltransferase
LTGSTTDSAEGAEDEKSAVFFWEGARSDQIRTKRLRLRAPERSDLTPLHEAISETLPELVCWLPWAQPNHGRADSRQYIRHARTSRGRGLALEYIVEDARTDRLLGIMSLHRIDWYRRMAGLGYWIRRSAWGEGVATEAGQAVLARAFRTGELHRVEAHVALENRASQRVVEKLGFQREGVARQIEYVNGRYLDHIQYSLLRTDKSAG